MKPVLISQMIDSINLEAPASWLLPLGVAIAISVVAYVATRPASWRQRCKFDFNFYKTYVFGPLQPYFPPNSKPPSRASRAFASIYARMPKSTTPVPIVQRRANFAALGRLQTRHPNTKLLSPISVPHRPQENSSPRPAVTVYPIVPSVSIVGKVNLYLHGGCYVMGGIDSHGGLASQLCNITHRKTFLVDYGLGPEVPVPKVVSEIVAVYKWLLQSQQVFPSDIILVGDSAGGGLCFLTALELKRQKVPLPSGIYVMSPWTDLSGSLSSWKTHQHTDVLLNPIEFTPGSHTLELATGIENATIEELQNERISPLFSSELAGLPPCLLQVGGAEGLLSDTIEMHRKLIEHHVKSTLMVYEHQQHVFQMFSDWIPEAHQGLAAAAKWIAQF